MERMYFYVVLQRKYRGNNQWNITICTQKKLE